MRPIRTPSRKAARTTLLVVLLLGIACGRSAGEFVGMLTARWFGFDLRDVPDGTGARRAGLRAGLGRLKLRAERAYAEASDSPRVLGGRVPSFTVRGDRAWQR